MFQQRFSNHSPTDSAEEEQFLDRLKALASATWNSQGLVIRVEEEQDFEDEETTQDIEAEKQEDKKKQQDKKRNKQDDEQVIQKKPKPHKK